jgi:trimeric autotransporter adhesin
MKTSQLKFPRRVRIHGGECDAVARALHHEVKISSPAVFGKVLNTTIERKLMTNKSTGFKRIALSVVVALGFGLLTSMPSAQATPIGASLTIDAASTKASSITAGDTATATLKTTFTTENTNDSVVVRTTCLTPTGASCGSSTSRQDVTPFVDIDFYWSATTDSATGTTIRRFNGNDGTSTESSTALGQTIFSNQQDSKVAFVQNQGDSMVVSNAAGAATSFTWSAKFRSTTSTPVGTYAITFYLQGSNAGAAATAANANSQSVTWNVTVSALSTTVAGLTTYVGSVDKSGTIAAASAQALYWRDNAVYQSAKESTIVLATTAADAQTPRAAGVVYGYATNAAGETWTAGYSTGATGVNICASGCTLTAVVEGGPGLIAAGLNSGTAVKSTTVTFGNTRAGNSETLTVYADGTAGTSTLKYYNGSTVVKSITLVFTGAPASATSVSLSDTAVAVGSTTNLRAVIKDAGGNALTSGTVYVWASDTNVVRSGAVSSAAAQYTQFAAGVRGSTAGACTAASGAFSCSVTIGDTGTSTLLFSDSWTVAASSWTSSAVTVTGHGKGASYTITFDKTSYTAGEQAVITLTGKDLAGRAATAQKNALAITTSMGLGNSGSTLSGSTRGVQVFVNDTSYSPRLVAGGSTYEISETFVVLMPATSGTFKVTVKTTPESTSSTQTEVEYTGSVTVINPAEVAANAAQAAADAATDAANEAIDAANAATDAANLAAEAADAATVAAEEARDAADAATAAVEELATQVATLMAALKAQITTLANTVAKIAKKVKA